MGLTCKTICWIIGVIAGLAAFAMMTPGMSAFLALVLAVIVAGIVGYALVTFVCNDAAEPEGTSMTPPATTPLTPTPTPMAPSPAAAPVAPVPPAPVEDPVAASDAPAEDAKAPAAEVTAPLAAPAEDTTPPKAADSEGTRPEGLEQARDGGADDLTKIKGVGPKLQGMLNEMGYFHFDQIAAWNPSDVAWVDQNLKGFKGRVSRDAWVDQARTLASGQETEFSSRASKGRAQ